MHLRCCGLTPDELAGVSGWQDVSYVQRDCLVRDIYDETEIKASDPAPQTEVETNMAQDATLESELWTFDEVNWHETAQDTTTIKYVPVQVRPAVTKLGERVAKVATEETGPLTGACMETLPLPRQDTLPHLRRQTDQQHKPYQGNQDPNCADRGRNPNKHVSPTGPRNQELTPRTGPPWTSTTKG